MSRGFIKRSIVILVLGYFLEMPFSGSNSRVRAGGNNSSSVTEQKESGKTEAKNNKRRVKKTKINRKKVKAKKKQRQ